MKLPRPRTALSGACLFMTLTCIVPDEDYCTSNRQCVERAGGGPAVCDTIGHFCRFGSQQCSEDRDCLDPLRPACDRKLYTCAPCTEGVDAPCQIQADARPEEKRRPYCQKGPEGPRCVECRDHRDCPREEPICERNECRTCEEHAECGPVVRCDDGQECTNSFVCIREGDDAGPPGRCARNGPGATGRVIYVRGPMGLGCSDVHTGTTFEQPKCTIDAAITEARRRGSRYIRLIGSVYSPPRPLDRAEHLIFIGAGRTNSFLPARVQGSGPLLQISGGARIVVEQVELIQDNPTEIGLSCKDATLTLLRSSISGSATGAPGKAGVSLSNCDAVLERNIIRGHGIGLRISDDTGRTYKLLGNVITLNKNTAIHLGSADGANLDASFNTLTQNGASQMVPGAVVCPAFPVHRPRFRQSIIADNGMAGTEGQFKDLQNCSFEQVVAGASHPQGTGLILKDPKLKGDRFHLDGEWSRECCIDKVESGPPRDIDGERRPYPASGAFDIGADEWVP